jgi:hypothetical protein
MLRLTINISSASAAEILAGMVGGLQNGMEQFMTVDVGADARLPCNILGDDDGSFASEVKA